MANEMIERAARAIAVQRQCSGYVDGHITTSCTKAIGYDFCRCEEMARAAIAAMRKPTDAMLRAGDLPAHEENTLEVWQEMIDAALSNEG